MMRQRARYSSSVGVLVGGVAVAVTGDDGDEV